MRVVTASVLALLIAAPLLAQEPEPQPEPPPPPEQEQEQPVAEEAEPELRAEPPRILRETRGVAQEGQHVVRRGDTLWDLAGRYLANPFQWPRIHEVNTRIVRDPHWIYPDQVLIIPGMRDLVQPAPADAAATMVAARDAARDAARAADRPARTVFYQEPLPRMSDRPTVLMEPLADRVPVKPGEFYRAEFLAHPRTLTEVGRVVRSYRDMERPSAIQLTAQPRDDLYISYAAGTTPPAIGTLLLVVDVGGRVPEAGLETRLIDPRAVVRVVAHDREVMRVHVEEQFGRVVRDHMVLPLELYPDFAVRRAQPVEGDYDLEATILRFVDPGPMPSRLARAFINAGSTHGVQVGDIFAVYLPPRPVREWDGTTHGTVQMIPAEAIAELRVVRVREGTATVIVDHLTKPQLEAGLPVRRVRRMP